MNENIDRYATTAAQDLYEVPLEQLETWCPNQGGAMVGDCPCRVCFTTRTVWHATQLTKQLKAAQETIANATAQIATLQSLNDEEYKTIKRAAKLVGEMIDEEELNPEDMNVESLCELLGVEMEVTVEIEITLTATGSVVVKRGTDIDLLEESAFVTGDLCIEGTDSIRRFKVDAELDTEGTRTTLR